MTNSTSLHVGVATQMNADIESLSNQVDNAQYKVDELTAVVQSLTDKQSHFAALLAEADTKKDTALDNYNQVKVIKTDFEELEKYSGAVNLQTTGVHKDVSDTAATMATLVDQLIFSADVIEKLSGFVNRQKSVNKVIPDELVNVLTQATADADNAVAVTLTALQSSYASVASANEARCVSNLETRQAVELYTLLMEGKIDHEKHENDCAHFSEIVKSVEASITKLTELQSQSGDALTKLLNAERKHKSVSSALETSDTSSAAGVSLQNEATSLLAEVTSAKAAYQKIIVELQIVSVRVDFYIKVMNEVTQNQQDGSLYTLIQTAYNNALTNYKSALDADNMAIDQLNSAKGDLARATTRLNSLKAGLEAAQAAAYAA